MVKQASTAVADVLAELSKRYHLRIGTMSDVVDDVVGLSTGNMAVDYLTGVGGLPMGRIVELYGVPSAGKSTTALQAAANLQQRIIADGRDEHILYLDFEHALDTTYAAALRLDPDHPTFILVQPVWLEDGADIAERLIRTGTVRLSIWDSVARMVPKDLEFGVRTHAMERARLMNSLLQRLTSLAHENNCAAVFLNHLVEAVSMGGRPGMPPQETSPGGKALKFYASIRLSYKVIRQIKGKAADALSGAVAEQVIATHVKVKCTKNKVGIPLREAEIRVRFGEGFDNAWTAVQVLVAHKVIRRDGAWYRFDEHLAHQDMATGAGKTPRPTLQGEAAVLTFADQHPEWAARLIDAARAAIADHGGDVLARSAETDDTDLLAGLDGDEPDETGEDQ